MRVTRATWARSISGFGEAVEGWVDILNRGKVFRGDGESVCMRSRRSRCTTRGGGHRIPMFHETPRSHVMFAIGYHGSPR